MNRLLLSVISFLAFFYASAQDTNRQNLGADINTEYDDLGPIISPDGRTLYYVIEGHPQNTKSSTYDDAEDIWYSEMDATGKWGKAKRLSFPFNQRRYNSIESVSADGNIVYIRGAYIDGVYQGTGFSYVIKTSTGWSQPQQMNIKNFAKMCKGDYTALWMCPDGKTLILAFSQVKDGRINDLFVAKKIGPNSWAAPVYIKSLNTKNYAESTPFMASDNTTMYFSSNRPGGMGDRDVWMTKRLDETWLKWSTPVNLGPTINSDGWDAYYTLDAKGEYAYMVSDKDSYGESDIVRIKLKEDIRPNPVVLVRGKVINAKTNMPITANIGYQTLADGVEVGEATSDPVTGEYKIILPYGKAYSFSAIAPNYIPVSNNLDLSLVSSYKEVNQDLYLVPIEVGQVIRLNNIFFDLGQTTLKAESYPELDRVVKILQENPNMQIEMSGHTDDSGTEEVNNKLSADRAAAVKAYIVSKGIAESRIVSKGYGESKPVAPNDTDANKQNNRRVEFTILKN